MGFQSHKTAATTAILTIAAVVVPALAGAQAVLRGVLYDDSTGTPLHGGAVVLVDPANDTPVYHAQADSSGVFSVNIANAGTYQIAAIHEGYQSILSAPVPFASGDRLTVKIPIAVGGNPVHHIGVTEHVVALESRQTAPLETREAEHEQRVARRRSAGLGIIYDHEKLLSMNAHTVGDVLAMTPGVAVDDPTGAMSSAVRMRQSDLNFSPAGSSGAGEVCHVGWYIDGQRFDRPGDPSGVDALTSLPLKEVDEIEVYRGISEVPAEYAAADLRCGVVAIWTRDPTDKRQLP